MIRVPLEALSAGPRVLTGEAARYVARVHRLGPGDALVVFDPNARLEADAVVSDIRDGLREGVELAIGQPRRATLVTTLPVAWIHGLPKGDKADAIVQDATELGASSIRFVRTVRAVVRLDAKRAAARKERWQKIALEAARQCGRGDVPTIEDVVSWEEALKRSPSTSGRYCLWEGATDPLVLPSLERQKGLVFAAGPEGGLEEAEAEAAKASGFAVVSLGERVLRTETVCAAVLGAVLLSEARPG